MINLLFSDPIPKYGDLMPLQEFIRCCEAGGFIDYDGFGKYSDGKSMFDIYVRPSDIIAGKVKNEFSHVVWFNR